MGVLKNDTLDQVSTLPGCDSVFFAQVLPNISKALWSFAMLDLNNFADEGTNILRNIKNCSPDNTASQPTRMGLSATPEPQMSQLHTSNFDKELDQNIILE
jgi:hypothetical protein